VITGPGADREWVAALDAAGAEVLLTGSGTREERFSRAMELLGARGLGSVLLEGGPTLAATAIASGEVDRFESFVAPILLGGGRPAVDGEGPLKMINATRALSMQVNRVGQDVHMSAQLKAW
jgi:diaminohydroxyphosphoribosylaminopyrimidine deaminase/5-amino-6-(5-phosphoribosylamino)uracil reductase